MCISTYTQMLVCIWWFVFACVPGLHKLVQFWRIIWYLSSKLNIHTPNKSKIQYRGICPRETFAHVPQETGIIKAALFEIFLSEIKKMAIDRKMGNILC